LEGWVFSIGALSTFWLVNDISGKGKAQHRLALFRALPCHVGAPAHENFTQVPDSNIYRRHKVNLTIRNIVHVIVIKHKYFGAHLLLRESLCWQNEDQELMSGDLAQSIDVAVRESTPTA